MALIRKFYAVFLANTCKRKLSKVEKVNVNPLKKRGVREEKTVDHLNSRKTSFLQEESLLCLFTRTIDADPCLNSPGLLSIIIAYKSYWGGDYLSAISSIRDMYV